MQISDFLYFVCCCISALFATMFHNDYDPLLTIRVVLLVEHYHICVIIENVSTKRAISILSSPCSCIGLNTRAWMKTPNGTLRKKIK